MELPRLSQSPTDPTFVNDPYPFYARARAAGDLIYWQDYDMIAATSHAAVTALLRDKGCGRQIPAACATPPPDHLSAFYGLEANSMLERDPPHHSRLRALVLKAFTSRRVATLAPAIEATAHSLIDSFPETPFDLLGAFAQPLPVRIIARLLGIDEAQAPQLLSWSNAMTAMYQAGRDRRDEEAAEAASREFSAYLADVIAHRRRAPADDLLTELIAARDREAKLTEAEIISTAVLLLNAGHEATVHTIGNGVKALCDTGTGDAVRSADTCPAAVEEILRYDPPLHIFNRWVNANVTTFGHTLAPNTEVGCLLASANRDPAVFDDPERFKPNRTPRTNASFGGGIHFCVGAPLARLELQIALRVLFTRCPDLAVAAPPAYADIYHFHGLSALQVRA